MWPHRRISYTFECAPQVRETGEKKRRKRVLFLVRVWRRCLLACVLIRPVLPVLGCRLCFVLLNVCFVCWCCSILFCGLFDAELLAAQQLECISGMYAWPPRWHVRIRRRRSSGLEEGFGFSFFSPSTERHDYGKRVVACHFIFLCCHVYCLWYFHILLLSPVVAVEYDSN